MTLDEVLKKLPPEMQGTLRSLIQSLPPVERENLGALFKGIPSNASTMRILLNLSLNQFKQAFGQKQRVAIVGPANVGKSTLYNQFVQHKSDRAEVSPVPGTTRTNQQADAGLFAVIDTPGADAVGEVGEQERERAFSAARGADFLIIMFDAIQGIKLAEKDLYHDLAALGKPYIVVLNKIDLVKKEQAQVIEKVAANLGLPVEQIVAISARDGNNLPQVLMAIVLTEPQMVAALGRALPQYRAQLAWRTIASAASVAAAVALTPLPVIDFVPLIVTQSVMVVGIARIYDYRITIERARELVVTFGLGFLGRTLFLELSKLGGVPGWILASAIASATTAAMGYAAIIWFEKGERLSRDTLDRITRSLTGYLVGAIKNIGKGRPKKEALQKAVEEALQSTSVEQQPGRGGSPPPK